VSAGTATQVVYETTVSGVGEQVPAFLDHGVLIFFGDEAPPELRDISVLHRPTVTDDAMQAGDVLQLGSTELEVLAAGGVVRDNLLNLGHFDLKADGRSEAKLPGDVCVPNVRLPLLAPGDRVRVLRPSPDITQEMENNDR
jgi:PTS system glucitol/sorbitol-specific IIA component